jgi:hypothetical protein
VSLHGHLTDKSPPSTRRGMGKALREKKSLSTEKILLGIYRPAQLLRNAPDSNSLHASSPIYRGSGRALRERKLFGFREKSFSAPTLTRGFPGTVEGLDSGSANAETPVMKGLRRRRILKRMRWHPGRIQPNLLGGKKKSEENQNRVCSFLLCSTTAFDGFICPGCLG